MRSLYNAQPDLFSQSAETSISTIYQIMSDVLEKYKNEILSLIMFDLSDGKNKVDTGRKGMTCDQVLRAALLKQQNQWSYEELAFHLVDSRTFSVFCKMPYRVGYSLSCLQANISKISQTTWKKVNSLILNEALSHKVERGSTIRVDSTVVDANIIHPTDSRLLYDSIRVIHTNLAKLRKTARCKALQSPICLKEAKKYMLSAKTAKNNETRKISYKHLLEQAKQMNNFLKKNFHLFAQYPSLQNKSPKRKLAKIENQMDFLPQIIHQTKERVIKGKKVENSKKIV